MVDEENSGTDDDLALPAQKSTNNGGSVPPSPLPMLSRTELIPIPDEARPQAKPIARWSFMPSAYWWRRCRGFLVQNADGSRRHVWSGDALQAATLSITKRVVNMNSALDRMVVLDQKLTMLDEGQAQLAEAIGQVEQDGKTLAEQMAVSMTDVQSTVADTSEVTRSGVESSRAIVAQLKEQSEQLAKLSRRVTQLESGFDDVAALKREISTLIEIERENLAELFAAQLALEQAQLSDIPSEDNVLVPAKVYPEGSIVFPAPVQRL